MSNESGLLPRMREELRKALPGRAFLKRDRGEALFVSNAPVFDPSITAIPGYILIPAGKLVQILPDGNRIIGLEQACEAPDQLSASLLRFRGMPVEAENLRLCAQGLKLLDMDEAAAPNEIEAYDRILRNRAALALRGAAGGGGLYAAALIRHQVCQIHQKENKI